MDTKRRVSCGVFVSVVTAMALLCVAVGLMVYFLACRSDSNATQSPVTPTISPPQPSLPQRRLPRSLQPTKYELSLQPYFPNNAGGVYPPEREFTFDGNVTITFECMIQTDNITLHMNRITLNNESIKLEDITAGSQPVLVNISKYIYDPRTQFVTFFIREGSLVPGRTYKLSTRYIGLLESSALNGFYPSSYVENGEVNWLVATQFEPTEARKALPCFDEPSFKASFQVNIIHPIRMKALSNGMERNTEDFGNGWGLTTFEPTPRMSSYLLAFAVCAFKSKNSYTKNNQTLFRVWARPSLIDQSDYAVAAGPKVLDYYADYFNISFPLQKQDMLALPDFSAGAMENWGLVTYRESALLFDKRSYASSNRQRVAVVIAHELSHQWFGDLVTMAWWDDLWLNEGFARYMEFVGSDVIANKAFHMDEQFVANLASAMASDQLSSSHPIVVNVETPDEINAIFDDISYNKGASIIRMLMSTVSEKIFQDGLRTYLSRHQYHNAVHNDLWAALTEAVGSDVLDWNNKPLNVSEYMNPWIMQIGYPVVTVRRIYTQSPPHAVVTQQRYLLSANYTSKSRLKYAPTPYNYTWYAPVWYQSEGNNETKFAWLQPQQPLTISTPTDEEWLLVNSDTAGYYRVNYDEQNWNLLQKQLQNDHGVINVKNRAQLLYDAFNLARAGYLDYNIALDTTLYLTNEMVYTPWRAAKDGFNFLEDMLVLSSDYQYYRDYLLALIMPLYNQTGWDDTVESEDDVLAHYARSLSKSAACALGYSECLQKANELFKFFLSDCSDTSMGSSNCSKVPTNLRKTVYCTGSSTGESKWWDILWDLHTHEQVAVEKDNLMYGLCCSRSPNLLIKLLDEAINPNSTLIRRQDARTVFNYIGINDVGRALLWQYLENNWPTISQFARTGSGSGLSAALTAATQSFNTEFQAITLEKFYDLNSDQLGSAAITLRQQIERVNANVEWMGKYRDQVVRWLKRKTGLVTKL